MMALIQLACNFLMTMGFRQQLRRFSVESEPFHLGQVGAPLSITQGQSATKRVMKMTKQMANDYTSMKLRHFLDSNALTLWAVGTGVLAGMMALPALL
jgi:hypothetical protein